MGKTITSCGYIFWIGIGGLLSGCGETTETLKAMQENTQDISQGLDSVEETVGEKLDQFSGDLGELSDDIQDPMVGIAEDFHSTDQNAAKIAEQLERLTTLFAEAILEVAELRKSVQTFETIVHAFVEKMKEEMEAEREDPETPSLLENLAEMGVQVPLKEGEVQ